MNLIKSTNPKLRSVSTEVEIHSGIKFGKKLLRFLGKHSGGVGLSAVQVGNLIRVFVVQYAGMQTIVINPTIVKYGKQKVKMEEGCLSFPGKSKKIKRSQEILVNYVDGKGKQHVFMRIKGFEARIFQHEYDHLNGVVCMDKK